MFLCMPVAYQDLVYSRPKIYMLSTTMALNAYPSQNANVRSTSAESIEALVGVTNERQTHTGFLTTHGLVLCPQSGTVVRLWNFIDGEVLGIDSRRKLGLEWSTNATELVPDNTAEEGVLSNFSCTTKATTTVVGVTDKAGPG